MKTIAQHLAMAATLMAACLIVLAALLFNAALTMYFTVLMTYSGS